MSSRRVCAVSPVSSFARDLFTPAAQKAFMDHGFRPVTAEGKPKAKGTLPEISPFTVASFGGRATVKSNAFGKGGHW